MIKTLKVDPALFVEAARGAMSRKQFTSVPGQCLHFVREVFNACPVAHPFPVPPNGSAADALVWFRKNGYLQTNVSPLLPGDLLIKGAHEGAPDGHIGIYVGNSNVAENSSTKIGRVSGAKGFRTLAQFGHYDGVVRVSRT